MSQKFRTDIEGLRGCCVLAVVLFHAFPKLLPGGFIGVDIFFVVSGYVISRVLLEEFDATGRISLPAFWARRIRRILPVATVTLLAVALVAVMTGVPPPRDIGRQIQAASLFYFNLQQARDAVDYLAPDQRTSPVLHYWSLAVEEQFYVIWPSLLALALLCARRVGSGAAYVVPVFIGVLWIASLAYSLTVLTHHHSHAFFATASRAWQLLSGCFVAAIEAPHAQDARRRSWRWLGAACLITILVCFAVVSGGATYPGVIAIAPTVAAAVLIHVNRWRDTPGHSLLSTPILRRIGLISFSWYLWHWPMLVWTTLLWGEGLTAKIAAIVVSYAAAEASYRIVECPPRYSKRLRASLPLTYLVGAGLIAVSALSGVAFRKLVPDRLVIGGGMTLDSRSIVEDRPLIFRDKCLLGLEKTEQPPCVYGAPDGRKTVVLFGDSHGGNWFTPLNRAASDLGWRLVVRIKASCKPLDAPQRRDDGSVYKGCAVWRTKVIDEIAHMKPDLIVVGGTPNTATKEAEARVLTQVSAAGPTVVMRDTPWFPEPTDTCLRRTKDANLCEWPLEERLPRPGYPTLLPGELPPRTEILDLNDRICPGGRCHAVLAGIPVMFDSHHFTERFAATLADDFKTVLKTH